MKKIILIVILGITVGYCAMTRITGIEVQKHHDCGYLQLRGTFCRQPVCQLDTNEACYVMWEKLFLDQNQIRDEYYNNHLTLVRLNLL